MKKLSLPLPILILVLTLAFSPLSSGQTHTFPALDTNNIFTGNNTFSTTLTLPQGLLAGPVTFSSLPSVVNGGLIYCSNCQATNPCTGGGFGAFAQGISGAWSCGGSGNVTSVFGRVGVVTAQTGDYTVAQITGAAPLASPTFTGITTIPSLTLSSITGSSQCLLASTLGVVSGSGAPCLTSNAVSSVFGRTGAIIANTGDYSVSQVTGAAPLASPAFTTQITIAGGSPLTTTNATGTGNLVKQVSPTFSGTPVIPTATQPIGILSPGSNGNCAITAGLVAQWGSCSGTPIYSAATPVTVAVNTTSPQSLQSVTPATGVYSTTGAFFHISAFGAVSVANSSYSATLYVNFNGATGMQIPISPGTTFPASWQLSIDCMNQTSSTNNFNCAGNAIISQQGGPTVYNTFAEVAAPAAAGYTSGPIALQVVFSSGSTSNSATEYTLSVR